MNLVPPLVGELGRRCKFWPAFHGCLHFLDDRLGAAALHHRGLRARLEIRHRETIGKFGGLQKIQVEGKTQEAIKLAYADNDIVYVSIHSLHKISKYSGKDGTPPKIYKLGSSAWKTLKQKTKARVKHIAFNLIQLYAKRRLEKGFACAPDSYLQKELESSFIYEDTPDQITATQDVKADMERDRPMDRLVCGDVGFGKTEVAIRAAFKAVDNRDRKSTRLNSSHGGISRMPSSA